MRAGPGAVYVQVDADPSPQLALLLGAWRRRLDEHRIRDIHDVIPAYRSLLIEHRPGLPAERVERWISECIEGGAQSAGEPGASNAPFSPRRHELPVAYGREADADRLAERIGLSFEEIVRRHAASDYTVAFLGFTAGFPYLLGLPPELQVARRERPRDRTPAGAVAIAGAQAGIYPSESPGGWWVLGVTDAVLFDPQREPPALLSPGDTVRFVPVDRLAANEPAAGTSSTSPGAPSAPSAPARSNRGTNNQVTSNQAEAGIEILAAWPRSVSLQATPRRGVGRFGMAEAGALDPRAFSEANEIVGNRRGVVALEAIGHPVRLRARAPVRAALTGGGLGALLNDRPLRRWESFDWPKRGVLELFPDRTATGYTTYLAVAGGFHGEAFGGSASTDARAGIGGARRYLSAGDELALARSGASGTGRPHAGTPRYAERVIVRIHPGPQHEDAAWLRLIGTSFRVGVLDRTGTRLTGPPIRLGSHETISEGSPAGAVQVPPDGQPIVLLADRGRTGGYAKPAVVDPRDLWLLAQAGPGTEIWLTPGDTRHTAAEPVHWKP